MNTEIKEDNNIKEKVRLDVAYNNYHKLIDKNLPYKYSYLDEWLLKKSKLLLKESESFHFNDDTYIQEKTKYRTYKRGTIIKVDFGVNLGSEMSQVHFAIVLNKHDNPYNNVLTVIPLTSKKSKFNLDLKNLVIEEFIKSVEKKFIEIEENHIKDETKNNKLRTLLSYYKSNQKNTYACCSLITTISKTRIFPPINEYDIIGKARCSEEVMNKIDNEILSKFTFGNVKN